jgi:hypothetical protein
VTAHLQAIWRHPIKAHGREALENARLVTGGTLPWDRVWAVAHARADAGDGAWRPCGNFTRGASAPELMAITARLRPETPEVTLTHPACAAISFQPDTPEGAAAFLAWVRPLMAEGRPMPARLVRARDQGMTDTAFPSISIGNLSSLRALSDRVGRPLSPDRFRANLWIEGLAPWEEFDLVGRDLRIGEALLRVEEPIGRCKATHANPDSGRRDTDVLGHLSAGWGHTQFGVYAVVAEGGTVAVGDSAHVIAAR